MPITCQFMGLLTLISFLVVMPCYAEGACEPKPACQCKIKKPVVRKHRLKRHHRRCGCYGCPVVCIHRYIPEHEPVEFRWGEPAPCGHYVNLDDCESYDPDRITGDDDPMIYPGMNIDN